MAPRQTARRLLVAAPALALALAVTACSPPNEQPADPDAPYTLPTYTEEAGSPSPEAHTNAEETNTEVEVEVEVTEDVAVEVPGQGQPAAGQVDPATPPAQPAP